jgi:hypothetical protein
MSIPWLDALSFAQKQRLQFIEAMLIWDGSVQRGDVCKVFDVTPNHLTRDIRRYRTCHKDALEYDVESRAYRRGRRFKPLLASGSPEEYLALLQAHCASRTTSVLPAMGYVAHAESVPAPTGVIEPEVLRLVMHALRNETNVGITYQSLREPNPIRRTIWPHILVYTGERWHVRAYDGDRQAFRDFVLSRCTEAASTQASASVDIPEDCEWRDFERIEIVPAPRLSGTQKTVIAKEFGMDDDGTGQLVWSHPIRKCLVGYFLTRYRLEYGGSYGPRAKSGQHPYLALRSPELANVYRFADE